MHKRAKPGSARAFRAAQAAHGDMLRLPTSTRSRLWKSSVSLPEPLGAAVPFVERPDVVAP